MKLSRPLIAAALALTVTGFATGTLVAQDAKPVEAAPADAKAAEAAPEQMPEGKVLPDIVLGNADAPVTVVEYASFTCSHCRDFHNETFPKLKAEYIDTGKVKFIERDVYFDAVSLWAGILAHCGGDDKYYPMVDILFAQQKTWLNAKTGDEIAQNLRKVGAQAGMTTEQMDACWADRQQVADLIATFQKAADEDKIEGTPTFIIGGEKVNNQSWDDLKKIIDAKIAAAG